MITRSINLFRKTNLKRTLLFLLGDVVLISLACWLGFLLRFDGQIPSYYWPMIKGFIVIAVPLTIFFFILEHLYSISWTYISVRELLKIIRGITASFLGVGAFLFIARHSSIFEGFPRSIIFISGFLTLLFTGGLRFSKRIYFHGFKRGLNRNDKKIHGKSALIVGAGDVGEQLTRHILSSPDSLYSLVGFIDEEPAKQGILIHGIRVLGKIKNIPRIIEKYKIEEIIIALSSVSPQIIKETVDLARQSGIQKIKIIPSTAEILAEKISLNHLREVSVADLLGRKQIKIDTKEIENYIADKTVLVTGAAGSIGSVLCEQILKFHPKKLVAVDNRETATFYLHRELDRLFPEIKKIFVLADICDENKMRHIFGFYQPQVVFHAAAYKHVPMMEESPEEAIKVNVFGTLNLGRLSVENRVEKFVMISTDKAINPTSVMGASKRICEMICVWLNKQNITKFCAVRFGNVLGSQGSVVPIFEKQIKKGGPIEITHPEMKRYFMLTDESCLLVMQAGALGQGGEVFILDMGQPVKIVDLAREMIKLAGLRPDVDIPIVFTGIRPGEKLFEEITAKGETPTKHEKIFIVKLADTDESKLFNSLEKLKQILVKMNKNDIIKAFEEIVPTFNHTLLKNSAEQIINDQP